MNRSNYPNLSATAHSLTGSLFVGCILAVAALTACQPQRGTVNRAVDATASQGATRPTDASLDTQLRLDPGEIQLYTQNIHG